MTLEILFYLVIVASIICYSVLDGFDLGVGLLHLFGKTDTERRIFLNSIGPVWDGNEVWLVVASGALFAGFPEVFATLLTTFYIPVMILLMGLIFRSVSIEFRSKHESKKWRQNWDILFSVGSFVIAFGVGLVIGNLIQGLPLDENHNFVGTFKDFIAPYNLLVGVMTVALFAMHGSVYLVMKTSGALHDKIRKWVPRTIIFFIFMYAVVTLITIFTIPYMTTPMKNHPLFLIVPVIAVLAIGAIPVLMRRKSDGWAFICSCISITALLSLAVIGTYPHMIRSTIQTETNSLVIFNSASSQLTLKILMIIVAIGIPLVLGYGYYIYRVFRGKVEVDESSY